MSEKPGQRAMLQEEETSKLCGPVATLEIAWLLEDILATQAASEVK